MACTLTLSFEGMCCGLFSPHNAHEKSKILQKSFSPLLELDVEDDAHFQCLLNTDISRTLIVAFGYWQIALCGTNEDFNVSWGRKIADGNGATWNNLTTRWRRLKQVLLV